MMIKPARIDSQDPVVTGRRRRRLAAVAMFPTMLTLGNLIFGFAASYQCALEMHDLGKGTPPAARKTLDSQFFEARAPSYLSIAVWLLMGSMICDALDGRVARLAKKASKFGEQLDSLADVVSFGVTPALMMVTFMRRELEQMNYPPTMIHHIMRLVAVFGVIYACCAALRLARFNVETSLEESAHRGFKGLPSPGAAGAVISVILLHEHLTYAALWPRAASVLTALYPFLTLGIALLMVSRISYSHMVGWLLGRRPFGYILVVLGALLCVFAYTEQTLFLLAWVFVLTGPIKYLLRRSRPAVDAATANRPPTRPSPEN